jgi:hypothetical protein
MGKIERRTPPVASAELNTNRPSAILLGELYDMPTLRPREFQGW